MKDERDIATLMPEKATDEKQARSSSYRCHHLQLIKSIQPTMLKMPQYGKNADRSYKMKKAETDQLDPAYKMP